MALAEPSETSGPVVLRTSRGRGNLPLMRLVIGGVASRHALSVDHLDDVELAVEMLFREERPEGGDLTLTITVVEHAFRVTLGGLTSPLVRRALSGATVPETDRFAEQNVLRMIMDCLVDEYATADEATGDSFAVEMEKRIP